METLGPGRRQAVWGARLLHTVHEGDSLSALLAYRCALSKTNTHFNYFFDERPALLVVEGRAASLTFIPLDKPCNSCSDLYSADFVQTLPLAHGRLLELVVNSAPRGDGPDSSSRSTLLWVTTPQGRAALQVNSRTEVDTYDDETETSGEEVCNTQVRYERDGAGNLTAIATVTTCTEDHVQKPSEAARYEWDGTTANFRKSVTTQPDYPVSARH